ncbi:MAG TPA: recombination mediator RecR [Candidatus Eisenbacteria bacterium]|nr:recombination mediator RecR [Candidatus Eisenbacteria bacterium]
MPYPESMVRLIEEFAKMPGVGVRTAERFALYVLGAPRESIAALAQLVVKVNESIHYCQQCFNLSENPSCHICSDPTRDHSLLCVVQDPKDIIAIEKAGDYRGIYHVLLGALSPLEGIGPKDLKIRELVERLKKGSFREVILGTSSDTEGDATSVYLLKQLKSLKVRVTRIAHGVPVGSALEFVDKATLSRAFRQRQEV